MCAQDSKGADLVSYVEQQHDYRLALKVHREALQATSFFWKSLMHTEVSVGVLHMSVLTICRDCLVAVPQSRAHLSVLTHHWDVLLPGQP